MVAWGEGGGRCGGRWMEAWREGPRDGGSVEGGMGEGRGTGVVEKYNPILPMLVRRVHLEVSRYENLPNFPWAV